MKLHTVFITYNRLELTKQAISSYLETVTVPFNLMVVDNGSTDGTIPELLRLADTEWVKSDLDIVGYDENKYPGLACNWGWKMALPDATHLHRADNDFIFLPGWCDEVERMFSSNPNLGQLGLRTGEEELWNHHNVGGNCIIKRELWDKGLRWNETPWPEIKVQGYTEDSFFSPDVRQMGYEWMRVEKPCIQSISYEDPEDPYYQKTWADRGIAR